MEGTEKVLKTTESILTVLQTNNGINKYLNKADIYVEEKDRELLNELLILLTDYSLKEDPIGQIIETLFDIMEDDKIKVNEIIKLLNVLIKNIKNIKNINSSNIKIENKDFALLLKTIIIILDDIDIIDIDEQAQSIFNTIDSCVFLIDQFDDINIEVNNNYKNNNKNNDKNNVEMVYESSSCKCFCLIFRF